MKSVIFVSLYILWIFCGILEQGILVWGTLCGIMKSLRIVGLTSHVVVALLKLIFKCSWIVKMRKLGVWLILYFCPLMNVL